MKKLPLAVEYGQYGVVGYELAVLVERADCVVQVDYEVLCAELSEWIINQKNKEDWFTIWLWPRTGMVWPHRNLNTVCIRTWTRARFMFYNFITWRCGRIGTRSWSLHRLKIIMKPMWLFLTYFTIGGGPPDCAGRAFEPPFCIDRRSSGSDFVKNGTK